MPRQASPARGDSAARGRKASAASPMHSATSSARSSARSAAAAATASIAAPTCATTSSWRWRMPRAAVRRRSAFRRWSRATRFAFPPSRNARRAMAAARNQAPSRRNVRPVTDAERCAFRRGFSRSSKPALRATAPARSFPTRAKRATAQAACAGTRRFRSRSRRGWIRTIASASRVTGRRASTAGRPAIFMSSSA